MSGRAECPPKRAFDGKVQVGILHNDLRVFSAQLKGHALKRLTTCGSNLASHRRRTGKRNQLHVRMVHQRGADFFSAALNIIVALNFSVVTWSATMSIYGIVSKAAMFLIGYAVMRSIGAARARRRPANGAAPASSPSAVADDFAKAGSAS